MDLDRATTNDIEKLKEFVVLVEKACKAEELVKERKRAAIVSRDSRKRQMGKPHQSSSKKSKEFTTGLNASMGFSNRNKNQQNTTSRPQTTSVASVGNVRPNRPPECLRCGRRHFSECRGKERGCFKYGSLDHFIRDCLELYDKEKKHDVRGNSAPLRDRPQKNPGSGTTSRDTPRDAVVRSESRAPGRTYAIRALDEAESTDVIMGTFSIHDVCCCFN
ncbi:uncharacterized protein [Gossypium hirsutum]|uniref:Gag-Pol polyprotein n=1 Tax=Gossypium hirsutum TaxID=3635 RepID=A0A1U8IEG8_GOSHI|nr:uncharacterized protein LOC107895885 [Gossypium hirsutum]